MSPLSVSGQGVRIIRISADKPILEEIFVEMWADEEYRLRSLYQQGYKDCIAILKALAVF